MKYIDQSLATVKPVLGGFKSHFGQLSDPRMARTRLYALDEILFVLLCGSLCGAESWRDFVHFGKEKIEFLREYFPFCSGIPSKNTFARVVAALDPNAFRQCFIAWVSTLQNGSHEVIGIDGKTLCNSGNADDGTAAIHMVMLLEPNRDLFWRRKK